MARTGEDASERDLETFAIDALKRFGVRRPTQQHPVRARGGRKRRVDLCYFLEKMAIEALGYEYHGLRTKFDEDAVRNNELVRAGYTPLFVTSAMTDWEIAMLIAEAIGDPLPISTGRPLTFAEWKRARYR
jgi:very-short-patch-repair endonuclease